MGCTSGRTTSRARRAASTASDAPIVTRVSTKILATKLYRPQPRPDLVARVRLIDRLDEGLHRKLTLLAAPAGFGKTTLLAEWLAASDRPVAWLSLDEADEDPTRFLTYVVAAVQSVVPEFGEGVSRALQSPQPPPLTPVLTAIVNELTGVPQGVTLVLDDYHVVDSDEVDRALAFLVEQLPPRSHLVLATREDPRLPLARWRARGQMTELRATDLRFTTHEAGAFLQRVVGSDLSARAIAQLEDRTEGWIAGLQLAALSMRGNEDTAEFIASFTGSHRYVLDYLVEEVLLRQPEVVQGFLLRTSILDRMCGSLCDAVLKDGSVPGQATLEAIERANLFVVPLDDERGWYRYHHLFAELLRKGLAQVAGTADGAGAEDVTELHRRASAWFEGAGLRIEAFRHAAAAHDVARAERLVAGEGMPLHFRGAAGPVLAWLQGLPRDVLDGRPSLWVLFASACLFSGRNMEAVDKLEAAEAALRGVQPNDANRDLFGRIAALRATLAVMQNDADTIMGHARHALELLDEANQPDRTAATWAIGYAHRLLGDHVAAKRAFAEVLDLSTSLGESLYSMAATLTLGRLHESEARLADATSSYERVLHLAGDPPQLMACEAFLGLARIAYERNDLEAAHRHVRRGLDLARRTEGIDTVASCAVLLARWRLASGDVPGADSALDDAEAYVLRHGFTARTPEIAAERVRVLLRKGHRAEAAALATTMDLPLALARVHLAGDDPWAASALLEQERARVVGEGRAGARLQVLALLAIAHHARGDQDAAAHTVAEALELAEPGGFVRVFLDEGAAMAHLLHEASGRGVTPRHAAKVLNAFATAAPKRGDGTAPPLPKTGEGLREALSERELEILRLIAKGLSNREIAERLYRALDTVKGHSRRIYGKLEVRNRTEAVARARELELL